MDDRTFRDDDGFEIFYRRWEPTGAPRLVVLVSHGMSEHSARYDRFAGVLTDEGCAVYALDHRGHGRTAESTGPGKAGENGVAGMVADLDQLADIAAGDHPSVPLVLFGHSMGSLVALAYAEQHGSRLAGLVLSGSIGIDDAAPELAAGLRAAVDGGMGDEPMPALSGFNEAFEPARTPYDWLSRDAHEVDLYVADPLCGDEFPMTFAFVTGILETSIDASSPESIGTIPTALPVLMITGEADPVSNKAANARVLEQRLREAGLQVEARYYPEARHELLNEINRDAVHKDILVWLTARQP